MPLINHDGSCRAMSRIIQLAVTSPDDRPSWFHWSEADLQETAAAIRSHAETGGCYRRIMLDADEVEWVVNRQGVCSSCSNGPGECVCAVCRTCAEELGILQVRVSCSCDRATCHESCRCEEADEDRESNGNRPAFYRAPLSWRGEAKQIPARYCGLELEVTEWADASAVESAAHSVRASIVEDGSIGDGVELVTQPTRGNQLRSDLDALLADVAEADESCGLHVHVDARDFGPWELRRLALLYCILEPALHALFRNREGGTYCRRTRPLGSRLAARPKSTDALRATLWDLLYPGETGKCIKSAKQTKYRDTRYYALNLHSWCHRKTVEFRLAAGTADPASAFAWACLCAVIVDRAYRATDAQIESLYNDAAAQPTSVAGTVYGSLLATLPDGCAATLEALKEGK